MRNIPFITGNCLDKKEMQSRPPLKAVPIEAVDQAVADCGRRADGPEAIFIPRRGAFVVGELGPVVAEAAHFVDGLIDGPVLVLHPQVGSDDAVAVMTGGAMEEDAAIVGCGEDLIGHGIERFADRVVGLILEGIWAGADEWVGYELNACLGGGRLL